MKESAPAAGKLPDPSRRIFAGVAVLGWNWILMQTIHEGGHLLAAVLTGGTVQAIQLRPLAISGLIIHPNPSPLIVIWAGPILGAWLPAVFSLLIPRSRKHLQRQLAFFAGFSLIANGAYIGLGALDQVGDCRVMLQSGSPQWILFAFGIACVAAGGWFWHQLGSLKTFFSFAEFDRTSVVWTCSAILILIAWELLAR